MKYAFVIEPSEHAELSASSTERWSTCTASPSLIKGLPNHSSKYAAEGTAAHHVSAVCLRDIVAGVLNVTPIGFFGLTALVEGHEILMDAEFIEHVEEYIDDIRSYRQPGDIEFIEQSFTEAMRKLHPKFGGSADYVNFRPSTRRLRVEDLKFGAGVAVEVDDNKQLKYYALGVLLSNTTFINAEEVEIRIAQPRCDHEAGRFRSYVFPAMELLDYAADLVDAAKETEDFTLAKLVPSPKACKWCPAAAANKCPALIKETHAVVAADFAVVDPAMYSPAQIAEFLQKLPLVEARIKAVREFAYQEALKGEQIPGFKLVEKRATRKWTDVEAAKAALGDNPLFYTTPELKSAPQIEKVLGKKKFAELAHLVDKQSSGYTLVQESDPRAPATVAQLSDFTTVEESGDVGKSEAP